MAALSLVVVLCVGIGACAIWATYRTGSVDAIPPETGSQRFDFEATDGRQASVGPPVETDDGRKLAACLDRMFVEDIPDTARVRQSPTPYDAPQPSTICMAMERLDVASASARALASLDRPETSPKTLTRLIGADPILTANVIKLANSPLFGFHPAVSSLEHAIQLMGLGNLKTLLCIEVAECAATKYGLPRPLRRAFWRHAGKTAHLARGIAPAFPGLDPGTLHTLGLLHDIGKFVLYGRESSDTFLRTLSNENIAFGMNHAVLGFYVCQHFTLPDTLCQAVRLHHAPSYAHSEDLGAPLPTVRYAFALALADAMVNVLDDNDNGYRIYESYAFLCNTTLLRHLATDARLLMEVQTAASPFG